VIRTHAPLLIEENVNARLEELGIASIGQNALSWLGVPMTMGNRVIGVIAAQSYATPRLYNERHRNLLTAVANQAVIAIENARLFKETQARAEREQKINAMTARIRAGFTLEQVLQATVQEVGRSLGAPRVAVWLEPASAAAAAPNERSISL
jgi:GAF domain-containing protein